MEEQVVSYTLFFSQLNSARSHWLLPGHNCLPPKSLSGQRYKIYNIRQLHQRTGSSLLPSNADQRSPLQRDLMNVQLYDKSLKDSPEWSFWKQLICFLRISMLPSASSPPRETKLTFSPRQHSLSLY